MIYPPPFQDYELDFSKKNTQKASSEYQSCLFDIPLAFRRNKTPKEFHESAFEKILSAFQFSETAIRFSPLAIADNAFKQFVFRSVFPRSFFTLPKVDAGMFPTFSAW